MPLADRVKLAEGKPLSRRMMAAMAQQDCGQCGYNCKDYSAAIFARTEERLNLCVPGGKETARMLKDLIPSSRRRGAAPPVDRTAIAQNRPRSARRGTIPRSRRSRSVIVSTRTVRRRKPGTSNSRLRATWTMRSVTRSASFR